MAGFVFLVSQQRIYWTISMSWSDAVVNGVDVTGTVVRVISHNGRYAEILLNTGIIVKIPTTHKPAPGDAVVEGELSL